MRSVLTTAAGPTFEHLTEKQPSRSGISGAILVDRSKAYQKFILFFLLFFIFSAAEADLISRTGNTIDIHLSSTRLWEKMVRGKNIVLNISSFAHSADLGGSQKEC